MIKKLSPIWVFSGLFFIIGIIQLLVWIHPIAIDDAFVYYTYAKNIVEGRPFAYDIRNIPSEGFTSLLYLLLLTPFEFFNINMPFASMLINISAIIITLISAGYLALKSGLMNKSSVALFTSLFWILIINDENIIFNINLGLETMLGPMSIILVSLTILGLYSDNVIHRNRSLNAFFILLFICYIIRPENMAFVAIFGTAIILIKKPAPIKILIRKSIIFAVFFGAYHLLKYAIFQDIFPTGFYRKVGGESGINYVIDWVKAYAVWFLPILSIILIDMIGIVFRTRGILSHSQWIWFLGGIVIITLGFFTRTQPIVGYSFRFLTTATFVSYLTFSLFTVWAIHAVYNRTRFKNIVSFSHYLILITFIISSVYNVHQLINTYDKSESLLHHINIYNKGVNAIDTQIYLKFGHHLNETLDKPEQVTLVFGDAGAVPYSFKGRFIDFNGLVEPPIAHLFSKPDGAEKTKLFTDYILSQNPDIIVLGWGELEDDGTWILPINPNSPFENAIPLSLYTSFYDYGIRYICTIYSNYYDIHIGIRLESPHYTSLQQSLSDYCQTDGYILPNGFTVTNREEQLNFEGILPLIDNRDN